MGTAISRDGTKIDFDRVGSGPPVVLLSAGPNDRSVSQPLVEVLKPFLTVYTYDHRARGRSGDTLPHTPEREFEDLAAVIAEAGGVAGVFGSSGSGNIALDAADLMPISRVAMWEPPYIVEGARSPVPPEWGQTVQEAIDAGRPEDGIAYWLTDIIEIPADYVAQMKGTPFWDGMVAHAQGLVYDASVLWDFSVPAAPTEVPVLVIDGGQATLPWIRAGIDALLKNLPIGRHEVLEGQPHDVSPDVLAPVLIKFFTEE
ncbi:alpha/beta fold hydrolase [Kibdelosporangium aridum]|uniref:alpha/beta fold hydrolase n=1 Tax=Kibdelosporangium aridum TaxID=2030 RepID=UPI000526367B